MKAIIFFFLTFMSGCFMFMDFPSKQATAILAFTLCSIVFAIEANKEDQ